MSNTINFSIDLGTTNSAIASYNNGDIVVYKNPSTLKETISSVVAFKGERIIVGDKAKEVLSKSPNNVFGTFKRKMGASDKYIVESAGKMISPLDLSSYVLKELKGFIHTGEQPASMVITIPAAFDTIQSNATKKAGYAAGFQEVVLLQEPIAASLAYANKADVEISEGKWLVYDLGGGTFDVALVAVEDDEMKVVDHEGDNFLGGSDFDRSIILDFILPELEKLGSFHALEEEMTRSTGKYNRVYNQLLYIAEEAKISLTRADIAEIEFDIEDDTGKEIEVYLELTKERFNEIVQPFIQRTIEMIQRILNRNQLANSDVQFILMVGGSTYVPIVKTMLSKAFNIDINAAIDPTTAVVVGAAYYAGTKPKSIATSLQQEMQKAKKMDIKIAYERVCKESSGLAIVQIADTVNDLAYRISRADGGYDSGLMPLKQQFTIQLPLLPNAFNNFEFQVLNGTGNLIQKEEIGITQGKFSIDGQPLPNHICIEVDSVDNNTTFLEPIFRKNAILPLKKTIVKQVSKTIRKDSDEAVVIKVLEGDIDTLPAANKTIGVVTISGADLDRDLVKGSDVELTFEITESRDLNVAVYLTLTDQDFENSFSPSEINVNRKLLMEEMQVFKINIASKLKRYEQEEDFESAGIAQKLIADIEGFETKIEALHDEDTSDLKFQIDNEKRTIGKRIHNMFNQSLLTKVTEEYYEMKSNASMHVVLDASATEHDQSELDKIVENDNDILKLGDVSLIKMKTDQLRNLIIKINNRTEVTDEDLEYYFHHYKGLSYQQEGKANALIKKGEAAIHAKDYPSLNGIINELHRLKKEDDRNDSSLFRGKGTGLK